MLSIYDVVFIKKISGANISIKRETSLSNPQKMILKFTENAKKRLLKGEKHAPHKR